MAGAPGHDPGQAGTGLSWADYVDFLVETHGSLTAVAEKLASARAYADDVASVERALRRLRKRGYLEGGVWGARALQVFGLPGAAAARARWMGAYHSRWSDLPVSLCLDLVRLWDRPPVNEAATTRTWLALAHTSCALRQNDHEAAHGHLRRARASFSLAPAEARAEILLTAAFLASRDDRSQVDSILRDVSPILDEEMDAIDRACLRARWIDQRAYEINHRHDGERAAALEEAQALYASIDPAGVPFAEFRRQNGLAYTHWKLGRPDEGAQCARQAAEAAGDGGHLRLRAMALSMLSKIVGDTREGHDAKQRAAAIVTKLEDEALKLRFRLKAPTSKGL